MTIESLTSPRQKIITDLRMSVIGRVILIALFLAVEIACWGGHDDFSRSFAVAIAGLIVFFGIGVGLGLCAINAFHSAEAVVELPSGIYAVKYGKTFFVLFSQGGKTKARLSIVEPATGQALTRLLELHRNQFSPRDAIGRIKVVKVGNRDVHLEEAGDEPMM